MNEEDPELLEQLNGVTPPSTGTADDDDEPEDEQADENEAPIRETSEATETPEELELDDEDG
ncbi:MAG TPA: hypothetical protein VHW71_17260 [Steroidobacteraceae bacterium]|nr:hypothetical protein [Steroidobacteraceae bacterium]